MSIINTGRLKLIIIPFDTGLNFARYMIDSIVYIILLLLTKFGDIMRDTATLMHVLVNTTCTTTWSLLPEWNSKPHHRRAKKRYKGSYGALRNLCASTKLCFNERNCKSGTQQDKEKSCNTLTNFSVLQST